MKRRGASMHAAPRTSLLLSQALPLGHPHRVKEDGKWVREGCFSIEGSTRASTQLWFSPCSQCAVCPLTCSSSSSSSSSQQWGAQIHKQIPDRACLNWIRTRTLIPRPSRTQIENIINFKMCGSKVIVNLQYIYTVYDRTLDDFPAKNTVCTPYI